MNKLILACLLVVSANAYSSCKLGADYFDCSSAEADRFIDDMKRDNERRVAEQYAAADRFERQLQESRDADNQRSQREYQEKQFEAEEKLSHVLRYGY